MIAVGKIISVYGLQGTVVMKSFTQDPESLFSFPDLLDATGEIKVKVASYTPSKGKGKYKVRLEGVGSRTQAEPLKGEVFYVPKEWLPALDEDTFYCRDLIGLKAKELDAGWVGTIQSVHHVGESDVLEILLPSSVGEGEGVKKGKTTCLVPFNKTFVPEVCLEQGLIHFYAWDLPPLKSQKEAPLSDE